MCIRDSGYYGQYIGVSSNLWSTLAPFISARVDDDQTGSKRVEVIRLAQADNQSAVRFRIAMAGTYAWYFGIDDFGLYSITSANPPLLASGPTPAAQTIAMGNSTTLSIASALGLGPFSYQWRQNGTNLPGKTAQSLVFPNVSLAAAGSYDAVSYTHLDVYKRQTSSSGRCGSVKTVWDWPTVTSCTRCRRLFWRRAPHSVASARRA